MNQRTATGLGIAFLGLVIAFLQYIASKHFLYWEFWWFDIVMHLLGGLLFALTAYWFLRNEFRNLFNTRVIEFVFVLIFVMLVGVLWEVFEYVTGAYYAVNYSLDTTLDLIMDGVGVLVAFLVYKRL